MTVKIGHASIDERGRASGGAAGDQTGREVCVRDWYAGGWNVLLRPKSAAVAEKMAAFCEAVCANPRVGYDQGQRNTLRTYALAAGWDGAKISVACETDCSAFMTVCAEAAGVNVPYAYGNAPTTWTMRRSFTSTGAFEALTDSKYLVSDKYLRRGDVLVRESGHTAMALSNGALFSPEGGEKAQSENGENAVPAAAAENVSADSSPGGGGINEKIHTVAAGDTLWGISQQYGVTVAAICAANGLDAARYIWPGQKLIIP